MLLCLLPTSAFAEGETLTLTVSSANAVVGSTLNVNVTLSNNPGIAALKVKLNYDESLLTLNSVTYNTAMGGTPIAPQQMTSPVTLQWFIGTVDVNYNGVFATLSFTVNETLTSDEETTITVTYDEEDITNTQMDTVPMTVQEGTFSIYMVRPGDINGDAKTNNKDLVCFAQYLADWAVSVSEAALDTNGDGKVNNKDLVLLAQFLADWDVTIFPEVAPIACAHSLTHVEAAAANCISTGNTEYWRCTKCGKYFADSAASTEIALADTVIPVNPDNHVHIEIIPAEPATYTSTGHTEGWKCTGCNAVYLGEVIPILEPETYSISYHETGNDPYLAKLNLQSQNTNPTTYQSGDSFILKELTVPGYIFEGWYDGQGSSATRISRITADMQGSFDLYAHWTERTDNTVVFDCGDAPLVTVDTISYRTSAGTTLPTPKLANYIFVGWTDSEGNLVTEIKPGTVGSTTLYANWCSYRNLARPVDYANTDPIIIEDPDNGIILFAYEIGTIENVPLYQIGETMNAVAGLTQTTTETVSKSIDSTYASNINGAISNATTNSAAWTISNDWNENTTVDETSAQEHGVSLEEAEQRAKTSSNSYSLNSSVGGASTVTNSSGYSFKLAGEKSHSSSDTTETNQNFGLKVGAKESINAGFKVKVVDIGVGFELNQEASYSNGRKKTHAATDGWKNSAEASTTSSSSSTNSKSWNSAEGYASSNTVSKTENTSKAVTDIISNEKHYGSSFATGGSNSENWQEATTSSSSEGWSDTFTYHNSTITTSSRTLTFSEHSEGFYRTVLAGKVHVFAVVGYDVAEQCYFVYTYSVLDDDTYVFVDYSKITSSFNDNESGVLPFEVPYFVDQYVDGKIAQTEGLVVSKSGVVEGYSGESSLVVIPTYYSYDNKDGTFDSVRITGIASNAFRGNNTIEVVLFGDYITEIPNGAFANCTSLEAVYAPAVTKIGANAFSGCTSLSRFNVSTGITELGTNAFDNVNAITVKAASDTIVNAAVSSGAKNIVLNTSETTVPSGTTLAIPAGTTSFELQGGRNDYVDLHIESDAAATVINGVNFVDCVGTPLKAASASIELNQVNIQSAGYGMVLTSDNASVALYGESSIASSSQNAILCKGFTLSKADAGIASNLRVNGNILTCGAINQNGLLTHESGEIIEITQAMYEAYLNGVYTINFNAQGGFLADGESSKTAFCGMAIGTLPTPTREHYAFDGWFTEATGGTEVTAATIYDNYELADINLYAHWLADGYQVTFNANGGSVSTTTKAVVYESAYGTLPTPTRTGYTFAGWYTAASGGSQVTAATIVTTASNHTLYAHWNANTYTVTFNANGGSGSMSQQTHTYDQSLALTQNAFTKTNCAFIGWSRDASAKTATYTNKQSVKNLASEANTNVTLYAVWESVSLNKTSLSLSKMPSSVGISATSATLATVATDEYSNSTTLTAAVSTFSSGTGTITATISSGAGSVSWSSSNTSVATVNSNGTVTAVGSGSAVITATSSNGAKATCNVSVTIGSSSITWTSSNTSVATVSGGTITAVGRGDAVITASTANGTQATCSVHVYEAYKAIAITSQSTYGRVRCNSNAERGLFLYNSGNTTSFTMTFVTAGTVDSGVLYQCYYSNNKVGFQMYISSAGKVCVQQKYNGNSATVTNDYVLQPNTKYTVVVTATKGSTSTVKIVVKDENGTALGTKSQSVSCMGADGLSSAAVGARSSATYGQLSTDAPNIKLISISFVGTQGYYGYGNTVSLSFNATGSSIGATTFGSDRCRIAFSGTSVQWHYR